MTATDGSDAATWHGDAPPLRDEDLLVALWAGKGTLKKKDRGLAGALVSSETATPWPVDSRRWMHLHAGTLAPSQVKCSANQRWMATVQPGCGERVAGIQTSSPKDPCGRDNGVRRDLSVSGFQNGACMSSAPILTQL